MSSIPPVNDRLREEKMWATLVHIIPIFACPILFPIIIMVVKPHQSEFVYHHAKQALYFHLAMLVLTIITIILCFVLIGFVLIPVLGILGLAGPIIGAVKANEGVWYRYPLIGGSS